MADMYIQTWLVGVYINPSPRGSTDSWDIKLIHGTFPYIPVKLSFATSCKKALGKIYSKGKIVTRLSI